MYGIKDLNFTDIVVGRICQITVVITGRQCTHSSKICRDLSYGVQQLHVPDVVNVDAVFQTHNQSLDW